VESPVIVDPAKIAEINGMLNSVVENGTGKRAQLPGIKVAGKTGTTNSYRDAWFMGFTGNFVAGVWYGNDDYRPLNKMTGGTLPAMTWNQVMAFAHEGVDIKPIPGVAPFPPGDPGAAPAGAKPVDPAIADLAIERPALLSKKTSGILNEIGTLTDDLAGKARDDDTTSSLQPEPAIGGRVKGGGVSFSGGHWVVR
jgi:penicillin-binding protein 1A